MIDWQNNSNQIRADFDGNGFVMLPGFFSPPEMTQLNAEVDRYRTEVLPYLSSDAAFYQVEGQPETMLRMSLMSDHDRYFKDLLFSDPFVKLAELLMEDEVKCRNLDWFGKPVRTGDETPPHQDGFYFKLDPSEALTFWLALDTVDEENGCVRYVPGSHRRGMRPHQPTDILGFSKGITDYGDEDYKAEVQIHATPGDMIAHHCMIIHRADPNPSERERGALGMIYYARRAKTT